MSVVLNVALPVFAIILAGYIAGRVRILDDAASAALNAFVYWFALPAVLFLGIARRRIDEIFNWPFVGAFLGAMLIVYALGSLIGWLIHRESGPVVNMQGLNAAFANTGYMGIPLFLAAFGPDRLAPAILGTVIMGTVMTGTAIIVLELLNSAGQGLGRALGDVGIALVKNPLIVSAAAGVAISLAQFPLATPLVAFFELLGASAGPCALFAIGLFLAGRPLAADLGEVGWITALKLLWQPLITWALIEAFFPLEPDWRAAAIILAALPTGGLTFVVAQRYGVYVERTSATVLVSTILSVPTLSILLVFFSSR